MDSAHKPHTINIIPQSLAWDSTYDNWQGPEQGTTITDVSCLVAPVDAEEMIEVVGEYGRNLVRVYCENSVSVNKGDQVVWTDVTPNKTYEVIEDPQDFYNPATWSLSHQEFLCVELK